MLERFSRLPIETPKPIIWIVALLTLIATPALLNVEFATDVQAFLPQSEEVETYDKITDNFGRDSSVVNLYITPLGDGNVLTMANLQEVLYLHEESSKLVGVKDVISVAGFFDDALRDSGTTLQEINGEECLEFDDRNGDGNYDSGEICHYSNWDRVWDTIKPSNKETNFTMNDLDFVTDVLVNRDLNMDPFVFPEKNKAAPMANSTLVMVYLDPSLTTDEKKDLGKEIRSLADKHNMESKAEVQVEAFSVNLLTSDVDESTQDTNLLMAIGMLIVTVVLLWITFRHWSYVVLPLITLIVSVIWTFAFGEVIGITFTAIDVAVIPLVVGLGIDFSVHISRRYQEGINAGKSIEDSLLDSQINTGRALTLAAVTTIIAFLSGISGGVGPVRDFSLLCAAGIFSSFILTILFYTSMRYILDSSQASETGFLSNDKDKLSVAGSDFIESSIYRVSSLVDSYPQGIVSAVVIVTLLALGGAAQINTSFSINDFLSDDLPIMVTGEDIQNDFRGADYLQSQILIEGDVASIDFLDGLYYLKRGEQGSYNYGLNDDRYIIKIGTEARIDSVHEVVQKAIDSEEFNVGSGNNSTHEWMVTNLFEVSPKQNLLIKWNTEQSVAVSSLDVTIVWYDKLGKSTGNQDLQTIDLNPSIVHHASVVVPEQTYKAKVRFSHIIDASDDPLVYGSSVHNSYSYIYVQSLKETFNLTYEAKSYSRTDDGDIKNLFDYLYQRNIDVADPFTGDSYSDEIRHVLEKDANGDYSSSVVRIYIGPNTAYDLDNDGLKYMREELKQNVPSNLENFDVSMTGGHILTSVTVNEIQSTQISSTFLSIILATVILMALYRNLGMALLAVVPTVLATVWIMATMAAIGITLNVLTVMVTALTIGLGIDYAIHVIERYREEIEHKSQRQAIITTIERTGSALFISGLTTFCGFAVLLFSPMPLVRNFGIITAATIVYSVIISVFVLPSLLTTSQRLKEWFSN